MAKCSTCHEFGHNKSKHLVKCIICGTTGETPKVVSDEALRIAKETYRCGDDQHHAAIRSAWGLPREDAERLLQR
jgi:DnaJ-class molecular chaperone